MRPDPLRPLRLLAWVLGLFALCTCRASGDGRPARAVPLRPSAHAPRARSYDVLHYAVELELQPEEHRIEAECRIRLQPLRDPLEEARFDLVGLEVQGVTDELGRTLSFEHARGTLAVELAEPLRRGSISELAVRYGGRPERGLWFSGRRLDGSGPTMVFSHGQTEGSRGWFPCFDEPSDRATSEVAVTLPPGWVSAGPGELVESRDEGGRRRDLWRLPVSHPSYLVSLVAGEFSVLESRWEDVPLLYLAEPRFEDWIEPTFAETGPILDFLADFAGLPYPYPKYSQAAVDNFPWGGMENISATTLTPLLLCDERGRRDQEPYPLIAHEAAHQWFGDLFTCADWSHLWLNEGFATYLTLLYVEETRGVDEFRAQLRDAQEAYLLQDVGQARRPTVWNVWKEPDDVFDTRAYQGAAARLHLLRFVLGDEAFRSGVRAYAAENAGRNVVTADFQRALEHTSGRELDAFFEQWFLARGYPEFAVDWEWDEDERRVTLEVDQVQESLDGTPAVFQVPVEVEVREERGAGAFRLEIDERRERYEIPCESRPLYVVLDPHGWIPKRVRQQRSGAEWLALARLCDDVNVRREAVLVLGRLLAEARANERSSGADLARELVARLAEDASSHVRAAAAEGLASAPREVAEAPLFRHATADGAVRARVGALRALRAFAPDPELAELGAATFEAGYSWQTMGAGAALFAAAAPERAFDWLVAGMELDSPHDVLAGLLLAELAQLPDPRVPEELERWASDPALAPSARAVALDRLALLVHDALGTSGFLAPFLEEESFHLRRAALRALARCSDPGALRALEAYYPRSRTPEERRLIEPLLERRAY